MRLNQSFVTNVHDIYGDKGESWIKQLPQQVSRLAKKWNFEFIDTVSNLSYNFVATVKYHQHAAILKIAVNNTILANESRWLECFSAGAPKLYWHDDDEAAYLMEKLTSGNSLKELVCQGKDDHATKIICSVIMNLQQHQHMRHSFKHVLEHAKTLDILGGVVDSNLLTAAKSLFVSLSADTSKDIILHGDLHHDNILKDKETWKAIDPHGYIGHPAFEVGAMIVNPFDCFPDQIPLDAVINQRLKILCTELPFSSQDIHAWAFCKTLLSIAWTYEDHKKLDEGELEIARIIYSKL